MFENEKIIESKTCRLCSVSFDITNKDKNRKENTLNFIMKN